MNNRIGTAGISPLGCLLWAVVIVLLSPVILIVGLLFLAFIILSRLFGARPRRSMPWAEFIRSKAPGGRRAPPPGEPAEAGQPPPASEDTIDVIAVEVEETEIRDR